MSDAALAPYLERPLTPADPATLAAIDGGPMDPLDALAPSAMDRLLDPAPIAVETGWCTLPDDVVYVAVRTAMPAVTGPMVDWWFDWHPRADIRYRVWHPRAHVANRLELPMRPGAKAHWQAVHRPVEDVGTGLVHARIRFLPPTAIGFSTDVLDDPRVATVVGGELGDDRRPLWHSRMVHVFLRDGDGVVLRSQFRLGAAIRPDLPAALAVPLAWAANRPLVRRQALPAGLGRALAHHCAEEYANLGALLPELYARYGS